MGTIYQGPVHMRVMTLSKAFDRLKVELHPTTPPPPTSFRTKIPPPPPHSRMIEFRKPKES